MKAMLADPLQHLQAAGLLCILLEMDLPTGQPQILACQTTRSS